MADLKVLRVHLATVLMEKYISDVVRRFCCQDFGQDMTGFLGGKGLLHYLNLCIWEEDVP